MKPTTATHLILLYLLSLFYGSTMAIGDSSHDGAFSDSREQSIGGKRTYKYRSEYKRLPLFQFGLGKRMTSNYEQKRTRPLSFGLGKRKPSYEFGLGKRSGYDRIVYSDELYADSALDAYALGKRTKSAFTFGLGKRDGETNDDIWLHQQRLMMNYAKDDFPFDLGKRYYKGQGDDNGLFA